MTDQERELEVKLQDLRDRIVRDNAGRRLWFWPSVDGVRGFLGTGMVVVAGLNPGTGRGENEYAFLGKERSNPYAFLYRTLVEEGLADAHLTDLVKVRGTDASPILDDQATMAQSCEYFAEELRIVGPFVIVGLGRKTLDVLGGWWRVDHPDGLRIEVDGRDQGDRH